MTIEIICLVLTIPLLLVGITVSIFGIKSAKRDSKDISKSIIGLKPQPPKIKAYFPGGKLICEHQSKVEEVIPITIFIENIGEETIMRADVSIYMDEKFVPKKLEYLGYKEEGNKLRVIENTPTPCNPYSPTVVKYVYTRSEFVIRKGEAGKIVLSAQLPTISKTYPIEVTLASNQGDGGIHPLTVVIN
jgi:hypothetical protein